MNIVDKFGQENKRVHHLPMRDERIKKIKKKKSKNRRGTNILKGIPTLPIHTYIMK